MFEQTSVCPGIILVLESSSMSETKLTPTPRRLAAGVMLVLCAASVHAQDPVPAQGAGQEEAVETGAPEAPDQRVNINEYIVRGNTVLDARAIERTVTPYLGPGRTMQDIESARAALQTAYQERGYQSVYVDLPEQQVSGGIVLLQVTETTVGTVTVAGAQHHDPEGLRERVPSLREGQVPDFNLAQEELTALNRSAKRQVIPLVKQGTQAGTMDVELKVEDRSPWRFGASVNNDHSPDTSALRSVLTAGHDNLWQKEHVASLTFFAAPENLDEANVWSGSYALPLGGPDWTLEFSGYTSDSDVLTEGSTNVTGRGHSLGVKLSRSLPMAGAWWHQLSAGIDFKDMDERVSLGDLEAQDVPLKYAPITLGYSGFRQGEKHQIGTGVQIVFGTRSFLGYGSDEDEFDWKRYKSDPSFAAVKFDLSDTYTLESGSQWGGRLSAQISDTPLVSGEQFAAGGMYTVRGYRSAEALGDYGAVGSLEWRTRPLALWGLQDWRLYTYLDAAWLKLREPLPEQEDEFSLGSTGVGSSFRLYDHFNFRFDYGYPLKDGPTTTQGAHRLHFSIGTSF
ncbi:ShlB/FhaC/HecB family hemolysin secretion/activation protein [Luteimonas sp. R10]|uniref:ShlB/FhaC/HecB family hemolysin secretion/activation protein n=1 Tax=Luteimonas sp. R10 TaxID=3108176 RepID=UPI0030888CD2|nr:ShlB/FhaC/HecB family hemolysin secretion/activation protein [Luteimonas sp. R10]